MEETDLDVEADEGDEDDPPSVGSAEEGLLVLSLNSAASTVFTDRERRTTWFDEENRE